MLDAHCFLDQSTWNTGFIFPSHGHNLIAMFTSPFITLLKAIEELLCRSLFSRGPQTSLPQRFPSTVRSSGIPAPKIPQVQNDPALFFNPNQRQDVQAGGPQHRPRARGGSGACEPLLSPHGSIHRLLPSPPTGGHPAGNAGREHPWYVPSATSHRFHSQQGCNSVWSSTPHSFLFFKSRN